MEISEPYNQDKIKQIIAYNKMIQDGNTHLRPTVKHAYGQRMKIMKTYK